MKVVTVVVVWFLRGSNTLNYICMECIRYISKYIQRQTERESYIFMERTAQKQNTDWILPLITNIVGSSAAHEHASQLYIYIKLARESFRLEKRVIFPLHPPSFFGIKYIHKNIYMPPYFTTITIYGAIRAYSNTRCVVTNINCYAISFLQ